MLSLFEIRGKLALVYEIRGKLFCECMNTEANCVCGSQRLVTLCKKIRGKLHYKLMQSEVYSIVMYKDLR